jgi:hypothetical protein
VTTPVPTVAPADADRDGRPDTYDLCPAEPAATTTGCPVPALRSLSVKRVKGTHRVRLGVRTTRSATVAVKLERRACNAAGQACRWRKAYAASRGSQGNRATFTTRNLARGRYRVTVRLSSPAGKASPVRRAFTA